MKNPHRRAAFRDSAPLFGNFLRRMIAHVQSSCEAVSHGISTHSPSTNPVEILLKPSPAPHFFART
jgi:hypothetical protein